MVKQIATALLLIALGFASGAFFSYRALLRPHLWLGAVGESFKANQYAFTKYKEASYPEAQTSLESYIAYLNRQSPIRGDWAPGQSPWLDERGLAFDKTLAWARLAMLHEANGNAPASDAAWKQAEALAAKAAFKEPGREHLREMVRRLDGQSQKNINGV